MKYCTRCGCELNDDAKFCTSCGARVSNEGNTPNHFNNNMNTASIATDNESTVIYGVLSFLFPIVGLILFLVYNDTKPRRAKTSGKCALASVIIGIVIAVGIITFTFIALASA